MKQYSNFDLTSYNSYNISAHCSKAYFPGNEDELIGLINELRTKNIPYQILGSGSNIILSKSTYHEYFIILNKNMGSYSFDPNGVCSAFAGVYMKDLSVAAAKQGLSGLEFFFDVPSSLGGALTMNAGCGDQDTYSLIKSIRYYSLEENKIIEWLKPKTYKLESKYRKNPFEAEKIIFLSAKLQLERKDPDTIEHTMADLFNRRHLKQPREYPSAGSVFKRPAHNIFVGPMIENLGLKGYRIGDAEVSTKHAGFIINKGHATGKDIIELINFIKDKVNNKFGITLETEQIII